MTAKKPAAAKRKPRLKKPATTLPMESSATTWQRAKPWLVLGLKVVLLVGLGAVGGVWVAGGIDLSLDDKTPDIVSAVFDAQESAFRKYSGELAIELKAGRITSEKAAADWMDSHFGPESEQAWIPLITEESKAFGGKDWTAEKQAAHIERYAR